MGRKIWIRCTLCGSHDVCRDATAEWDVDAQAWTLQGVQDQGTCQDCEVEVELEEVASEHAPLSVDQLRRRLRRVGQEQTSVYRSLCNGADLTSAPLAAIEAAAALLDLMENGPLPSWAKGRLNGQFMTVGAQLCTRDGRRMGNAVVVELGLSQGVTPVAEVVTDMGNRFILTEGEMAECFYPPSLLIADHERPQPERLSLEGLAHTPHLSLLPQAAE